MRRRDQGSATAELAVACPALIFLLVASLSGIGAVLSKLRCSDAAREAALAAARGEAPDDAARRVAPAGATVKVRVEGDLVRAVVRVQPKLLGLTSFGLTVHEEAVAAMEPVE